VVVSILVWLALAVTIFGLIYAAIFAFFLWLGNGLMVARNRSAGPERCRAWAQPGT
jgi:hypothetical protein